MRKPLSYKCVLANDDLFINDWTERQLTKLWGSKEERERATARQPKLTPLHVSNVGYPSRQIDFNRIPQDQGKGVNTFPRFSETDPTYGGRINPEEKKRRNLFDD